MPGPLEPAEKAIISQTLGSMTSVQKRWNLHLHLSISYLSTAELWDASCASVVFRPVLGVYHRNEEHLDGRSSIK